MHDPNTDPQTRRHDEEPPREHAGREPRSDDAPLPSIEDMDPEELDRMWSDLQSFESERAKLEEERNNLLRAVADARNAERIARQEVAEARRQSVTSVARDVITALDHFDLALLQDPETASASQVMDGVRVIRAELIRTLSKHGIGLIEPAPGDEFDPGRHEALASRPHQAIEHNRVIETYQVGYTLGDRVIRPAKVAVSTGPAAPAADEPPTRAPLNPGPDPSPEPDADPDEEN